MSVHLTRRESQIDFLIYRGAKNKEIGAALGISEGTVKVYLSRLFRKLGISSRLELATRHFQDMQQINDDRSGSAAGAD